MEEIEKRFELIGLAIELSDYKVIDLQINHLRNVSTESHLHAILDDLEGRNFRQALYEMKNYSVDIKDDFFETQSAGMAPDSSASHNNLFDLAEEDTQYVSDHIVSVDDMMEMTKESAGSGRDYGQDNHVTNNDLFDVGQSASGSEADPLFSLDQDIPPTQEENIHEEMKATSSQSRAAEVLDTRDDTLALGKLTDEDDKLYDGEVFSLSEEEHREPLEEDIQKDIEEELIQIPEFDGHGVGNEIFAVDASGGKPKSKEKEYDEEEIGKPEQKKPKAEAEVPPIRRAWDFEPDEEEREYPKFAYMDQKFRNMLHQHPRKTEEDEEICLEAKDFIDFVTTHNYTESQVEAAISRYQELKTQGKSSQAAQMLIAAATTESTFAQFMLARELFKGDLLEQNYPEAFTRINQLAEEDYPEAICDLGQLYEYGIGIDKNKRHALLLYEEAAEMGIERAQRHYERLSNTNPLKSFASITSSFLSRKKE